MSNQEEVFDEQLQEVIKEWKALGISYCHMTFSCGGDQMDEYTFAYYDEKGREIKAESLDGYFDIEVFDRVDFYEASDGHYVGERGYVEITLEEEEGEGSFFNYSKCAVSIYNEEMSTEVDVKLTEDESRVFKENIVSISKDFHSEDCHYVYRKDCIISEKDYETIESIEKELDDTAETYDEWEHELESADDQYRWTASFNDSGKLVLQIIRFFIIEKGDEY